MSRAYSLLFQGVFRRMDPERAHELAFSLIERAGTVPVLRDVVQGALAPYLGQRAGGPAASACSAGSCPRRSAWRAASTRTRAPCAA